MRILLLTAAIAWCPIATLNAAMVISVKNATMTAGGSGTVDVYLTGEAGDELGRFGYEFKITGATAGSGDLQFSDPQSNSEQIQSGPTPYVFFLHTDPENFIATRGTDPYTLIGGDVLAPSRDSVSIEGEFLLARLEIQHVGPFSPGSYDFEVSLNVLSQQTLFDRDWEDNPETPNGYLSDEFSTTSGIVTVNAGTAAVPEPGSCAIWTLTGIFGFVYRRRMRRSA